MIDEVSDVGCPLDSPSISPQEDEVISTLRSSQRIYRTSFCRIDLSTARRKGEMAPEQKVTSAAINAIPITEPSIDPSNKHTVTRVAASPGGYLLGIAEMLLGGTLMVTGAVIEIGSFGSLTVVVGLQEAAGFALLTHGFAQSMNHSRDLSFTSTKYKPVYNPIDALNISKGERKSSDEPGSPSVRGDRLVGDGTESPATGFEEWRGHGDPDSGRGSWYNPDTGESLHPDLHHPPPDNPHWDYEGPAFPRGAKIYLDGTWASK